MARVPALEQPDASDTTATPHTVITAISPTPSSTTSPLKPLQGLAVLLLMQSTGEALSHFLHLPIPGPVVGMVLLLAALHWGPVQRAVAPAAGFLLTHLSLLFVPVGVGVMTHLDLLGAYGLRLLVVIVLSTWAGMAATVWVLRAFRRSEGRGGNAGDAGTAGLSGPSSPSGTARFGGPNVDGRGTL